MTKPLKSFPESERKAIARRRVAGNTGGLGYVSAVAFLNRIGEPVAKKDDTKKK